MNTYFIGDVHGCYDELMRLLERLHFKRGRDRLVFVGDLINRGPKSLAVLRFVRDLGDDAQVVLGNHDLSLFAYALGLYHGRGSDYPDILAAADGQALFDWLRQQPLLIADDANRIVVTHAGIPPRWSLEKAKKQARKAEKKLRGDQIKDYLRHAYGRGEDQWQDDFNKRDKFRYRLNGFTRLRYCDADGEPDFRDKCPVGQQSAGLVPWFEARQQHQNDGDTRLIFGHWAALGYRVERNAICLDSGCAWGGKLTAISLSKHGIKCVQIPFDQKK